MTQEGYVCSEVSSTDGTRLKGESARFDIVPIIASRVVDQVPSESRLAAALQHRFYLRVHMAAMLTATLLVVAVIASFAWRIWAAPAILSEVAFDAVLAGALAKHAHNATRGNWVGSVMKKTMIPFLLT